MPTKRKRLLLRIGKLLARAGLAPRRQTADFLRDHSVVVNGEHITELNYSYEGDLAALDLKVDGKSIKLANENQVLLLHKPRGVVCSHRTQHIRGKPLKTIFDLVAAPRPGSGTTDFHSWFFAGRLDVSSEGLVLLSNDGDHVFALTHPSHGTLKKYFVRTSRPLSAAEILRAEKGVMDKGDKLRFEKVIPLATIAQYEVHLKEGKNREIRRVLERLGVYARQLVRTQLGPYELGDLKAGEFRLFEKLPTQTK